MGVRVNPVQIKGQKDGLWIFLDDQLPASDVLTALEQKLASSQNFFAGAEVTINIGSRVFSPAEKDHLCELIEQQHALKIRTIETGREASEARDISQPSGSRRTDRVNKDDAGTPEDDDEFLKLLDETFRIPVKQRRYHQDTADEREPDKEEKTLYFRGTVRSGQLLEFPGNVVIMGDVNPGAYVSASGDILVMGRLYGVVQAGAEGNEQAVIISPGFFPSQLRIAHFIGRPPDDNPSSRSHRIQTEKASIKNGAIVIEPIL
jgi:septum site-determining protein MinC